MKSNLFAAYLRPKQTTISLISTTTSSSAAFPGGEAFDFTFSPSGQWCLALSSSRIFVLDTAAPKVAVNRELKVPRKPVSAAILDDGGKIAVLSTDHEVNVYDLTVKPSKHLRSVSLDEPPHVITMSPKGEVLAAAYDGGVEVHSLAENASATQSRAVKCDRVDSLAFSSDGTMLLGTTLGATDPNTVILSAPYFTDAEQDMPHSEMVSHMWTSQILFPNSSRDSSHATLLPRRLEGNTSWTLTYDRVFESFRAVRTDDLRNGTTYFTGPKQNKSRQRRKSKGRLVPCTLPSVSQKGDLVAAGFLGNEIWLYGVPEELDVPTRINAEESSQGGSVGSVGSAGSSAGPSSAPTNGALPGIGAASGEASELERLPRWQVLVDKYRNVFAKGRRVAIVPHAAQVVWVGRHSDKEEDLTGISERLIVAAPGGVSGSSEMDQEELASVDGGRLIILDFDWTASNGTCEEMTIEVGDAEPELLEEKHVDMDTEIAIVRRRTVRRSYSMSRASVAEVLRPQEGDIPEVPPLPQSTSVGFGLDMPTPPQPTNNETSTQDQTGEGLTLAEVAETFDGPYSHTQPRSRNTLYRSATAVAANRQRNPPRIPASGRVEYRRTDGTELPHESDADHWVPPPPPYTPDTDRPIPDALRVALMSRLHSAPSDASGSAPPPQIPLPPTRTRTTRESFLHDFIARRRSVADVPQLNQISRRPLPQRQHSDGTGATLGRSDSALFSPISPEMMRPSVPTSWRQSSYTPPQRPQSAYENRPPQSRSLSATHNTFIPPVPEITHVSRPTTGQTASLPPSPIREAPASSNLTVTGANLQQRLDYPLPPPPPADVSPQESVEDLPQELPLQGEEDITPPELPSNQSPLDIHLDTTSLPSSTQLTALRNRYSSIPNPTSPTLPNRPSSRFYAQGQGPPRAALGAAGSPTNNRPSSRSSSFFNGHSSSSPTNNNIVEAPARVLSQNNSRRSRSGSISSQSSRGPSMEIFDTISVSSPNLPRPRANRMDTIYSVTSRNSRSERERDQQRGEVDMRQSIRERPFSGMRTRTRSEGPPSPRIDIDGEQRLGGGQEPSAYMESGGAGGTWVVTAKEKKGWMARRRDRKAEKERLKDLERERARQEFYEYGLRQERQGERRKKDGKEAKCVVM